ncbi:hypothetical protein [Desulfobotulus mexicanus]|uniref:Uncharacterized protein n=1 Tax=Desulfobotulus mexicanus TaxID=2586642 RepID=A0A5S5MD83_9BACT|nr:hypothetical protein [Desulfobotulus mexicanus]TYT73678.1 hypothetical protein FIM25_13640 [Desulfobotulus mexicanus]
MIPEIKIIHQLSLNEIFEVKLLTESDLKAWVANGHYLVSECLEPSTKNRATEFELQFQQSEILHASLANDCNRFAQAAIESIWSVGKINKLPKSTGWAAVQMYYSAFFAAHALLRIYGLACSQLEGDYVDKVFQIASVTELDGGVSSIENGFYFSSILNNKIKFNKLKDSHADTWLSFSKLLIWLIDNISNTTGLGKHKSDALTLISNIKAALHMSGAAKGNWPSQIRNKVNYQHTHGVWYPYKGALHDHDIVLRNTEWLKSPVSFDLGGKNNDILTLYNVSNSIVSLMYHLMNYGYERAGKVSLPLSKGIFRLINQIRAA